MTTGEILKQEALALVESHTPEEWKKAFAAQGHIVAQRGDPFTSEEIIFTVGLPPTPNAIGAAMSALTKELKLVCCGYSKATRPSRHAGVVAVWRLRDH